MAHYHLTARSIMHQDLVTILSDASIQDAADQMRFEGVRSLIVEPLDDGDPYAIVTYSDIVREVLADGLDPADVTVDQIMTKPAVTIAPDLKVEYIAKLFRQMEIGHAPVIENGIVIGIVSMTDLITEVISEPHG